MRTIHPNLAIACLRLRVPASDFLAYDTTPLLPEEAQILVHKELLEIAKVNAYFVKIFLSQYIRLLEKSGEVCEDIYELYCDPTILGAEELNPTATDILHYVVDAEGATVAIRESPKVFAGNGTTGLRTWEAALYLLNYLNKENLDLQEKNILELGTGTGLVSLALARKYEKHQFEKLTLTDGDAVLIGNLHSAFSLNGLDEVTHKISTQQLLWGSEENSLDVLPKADIIIASDVTYDSRILRELCETIADLMKNGATMALIAATVRNIDTVTAWEKELQRFKWTVVDQCLDPHLAELPCWFKLGTPEIRIYKIYQ